MAEYNIPVEPEVITVPRVVKFPSAPNANLKNQLKKVVVYSPAENPSTKQFAFELLEAELQLDSGENVDQGLITKLFQLYRLGIEYYNQRRSKRQSYFKKKLQGLTNNPVVLGALHECDTATDTFYKKKQIEKLLEIDQRRSVPANELLKSVFQNQKKVQTQLKTQSDLIQKRLNERRLIKKSCQGESIMDVKQIPETPSIIRKKLNKTMIVKTTNPEEDQSKYFVEGAIISHEA